MNTEKLPKIVDKKWGYEIWIANSELYCGKILHVNKDFRCSMHFHVDKIETFYIYRGSILMRLIHKNGSREEFVMHEGDVINISRGLMHQFEGLEDTDIIEISTQHFDEDSYRVSVGGKVEGSDD